MNSIGFLGLDDGYLEISELLSFIVFVLSFLYTLTNSINSNFIKHNIYYAKLYIILSI